MITNNIVTYFPNHKNLKDYSREIGGGGTTQRIKKTKRLR